MVFILGLVEYIFILLPKTTINIFKESGKYSEIHFSGKIKLLYREFDSGFFLLGL